MDIEIDFAASSHLEEACPFTLWLPMENVNTPEFQRALVEAEQIMTGTAETGFDIDAPAAGTFLGQWL